MCVFHPFWRVLASFCPSSFAIIPAVPSRRNLIRYSQLMYWRLYENICFWDKISYVFWIRLDISEFKLLNDRGRNESVIILYLIIMQIRYVQEYASNFVKGTYSHYDYSIRRFHLYPWSLSRGSFSISNDVCNLEQITFSARYRYKLVASLSVFGYH